jgi:hypothetical protein
MTTLIVLFNLKDGVSAAEYEEFARTVDVPTVKALKSVDEFQVFRSSGVLGSDAQPPYKYVEVIQVNDMNQLGADVSSETMQRVAAQFRAFADNPVFMLTEQFA